MKQLLLVFASVILVCVLSFRLIQDLQQGKQRSLVQNQVENVLNQSITDLELLIYPSLVSAVVLSNSDEMVEALKEKNKGKLVRQLSLLAQSYSALSQVRILDEGGVEYCRVNRSANGVILVPEEDLQDKSGRDYFIEATEMTKGHIYVSQLEYNKEHGELSYPLEPVIRVISPIDAENNRLGYLIFNIAFDKILRKLSYPEELHDIGVYITDLDKKVLLLKDVEGINVVTPDSGVDYLDSKLVDEVLKSDYQKGAFYDESYYIDQEKFQLNTKTHLLPKGLLFHKGSEPIFRIVVTREILPIGFWSSLEQLDRFLLSGGLVVSVALLIAFAIGRVQIEKRQKLISELNDELIISQARLNTEKRKLQSLVSRLAHKNSLLKEFSTIVSHNFRSPVSSLGLLVGYFKENYKSMEHAELKEIAGNLTIASKNFNTLADDLADTIGVINNEEIKLQKVNLRKVADRVLEKYRYEMKDSTVQFHMSEWSMIVYNEEYLRMILDHLFSNSFHYRSSKRKLIIALTTSTVNEKMVLQFEDNGQGLDLDLHANNIFGMHRTFHENPEGRGMGLFLVKLYMENLGGNVFIESKPNVGTKFTLMF